MYALRSDHFSDLFQTWRFGNGDPKLCVKGGSEVSADGSRIPEVIISI